jgi:hypothetical protein
MRVVYGWAVWLQPHKGQHHTEVSPLLFNLLVYNIIPNLEGPGKQLGLKLKMTHQLLVYADDINQWGDNINTIKRNRVTLLGVIFSPLSLFWKKLK